MDKLIRKAEKDTKKVTKELKHMEKLDKPRDKKIEAYDKMKGNKK